MLEEYLFDVFAERVRAEIIRQSKVISNLSHAFDLLEASDKSIALSNLSESRYGAYSFIGRTIRARHIRDVEEAIQTRYFTDETKLKLGKICENLV